MNKKDKKGKRGEKRRTEDKRGEKRGKTRKNKKRGEKSRKEERDLNPGRAPQSASIRGNAAKQKTNVYFPTKEKRQC